jgi:ABC-type molybdate transport system substrate-binding protein
MATPTCFRWLLHAARRADSRAACTAGSKRATSRPTIAITTKSDAVLATGVRIACRAQTAAAIAEYRAAVLNTGRSSTEAEAFLEFLTSPTARRAFRNCGFSAAGKEDD